MKSAIRTGLIVVLALAGAPLSGDVSDVPPDGFSLSPESRRVLETGLGSTDDGQFSYIAGRVSSAELIAAFYDRDRAVARVAVDAAGYSDEPWDLVPWLAAFIGAGERPVASAAAAALLRALNQAADLRENPSFPVQRQADHGLRMLNEVVGRTSVAPDLRVAALWARRRMIEWIERPTALPVELWRDPHPLIRDTVLGLLDVPLSEAELRKVAEAVSDDDPGVRGHAASLLCENALSHGVERLSADLSEVIRSLLEPGADPRQVAPLLPCLSRFPYESRADISDLVLKQTHPGTVRLWKSLTETD